MNDTPTEGKSSGPASKTSPITSGQVLRQVAVIIVVVAVWSAILVGYLALQTRAKNHQQPPRSQPRLWQPQQQPKRAPGQTETAPSTATPTSEAEATQPSPADTARGCRGQLLRGRSPHL